MIGPPQKLPRSTDRGLFAGCNSWLERSSQGNRLLGSPPLRPATKAESPLGRESTLIPGARRSPEATSEPSWSSANGALDRLE